MHGNPGEAMNVKLFFSKNVFMQTVFFSFSIFMRVFGTYQHNAEMNNSKLAGLFSARHLYPGKTSCFSQLRSAFTEGSCV
jgi:hypothetical protein